MALRDFYTFSDFPIQPANDWLAPTYSLENNCTEDNPIVDDKPIIDNSIKEDILPVSPVTQGLAQKLEASRLKLQNILIKHPYGLNLLTEQFSKPASVDGVNFSVWAENNSELDNQVVQDNSFVQDNSQELSNISTEKNRECTANSNNAELDHVHFFTPILFKIVTAVEQNEKTSATAEPGFVNEMLRAKNRLHLLRQEMINKNTGLVAFVAYKYKNSSIAFEDLMQEGIVGLIKAIDRFDPNRGIRFSTYAVFWIKQAITRLIIKQEKVVRLPVALAEKASVVFEIMRNCYQEHNRWPSVAELHAQCSLSKEEIRTISSYYQATHSLDIAFSGDTDDITLLDTLKQDQFALPLNELIDANLNVFINNVVASLPEKEATIINMRFGLKNQTEMTLQAIADQLHVTRERVRQIQNQALNTLKQQFGYDLMPFLESNDF